MEALKFDDFVYYTYSDYLTWDDRWELIDGIAYAMSPAPYPKHQRVASKIWRELDANLSCADRCEAYLSPIDWKINDTTVVQPDIALFCEQTNEQYFSKTPPLIVEVLSKSTALKDVTTKFELYEREGVLFYIIIEPNSEVGDIFKLINGKYELQKKITKADNYSFELDACESRIDFGNVFGR